MMCMTTKEWMECTCLKPTCHEFLVWIAKETTPVIVCGKNERKKKKKEESMKKINICKIDEINI